ncbi:hypothetical protein HZC35_03345 [Candidatus Saganbacteria bacterium]|nr:hypothetical protein [Candidatus Saganbacteria bacterium]
MRRIIAAIAFFFLLAGLSSAYTVTGESFASAGGSSTSANYALYSSMGDGLAASAVTGEAVSPTISNIQFDGKTVISGDYVSANPTITATITDDSSGIDTARSAVELDGSFTYLSALPAGSSYLAGSLNYKPALTVGTHSITFHAADLAGNWATSEALSFKVDSGEVKISGAALNYPNPFNPASGQTTEINYELNINADIVIYLYDLIGRPIKKITCPSGTDGGRAGYNRVTWNGISDFGEIVANDVYIARITQGGKQIGKCKIAVLK